MSFNFIIIGHFIADFLVQNNYTSANKGKDIKALSLHVGLYFLGMCMTLLVYPSLSLLLYCAVNAVLHYFVDGLTSPYSAKFYELSNKKKFFLLLGFDQMVHMLCLSVTYGVMFAKSGFFL
jgi:hypothetical protein